jgi:hypothetical protein
VKQPLAFGRKLPRNDWEGDDPPVLNFKSCTASAGGRQVAWSTNGRVDIDGARYYVAAPHDPKTGGQTLTQLAIAINNVAHLQLVTPGLWTPRDALNHLTAGGGLITQGYYGALPRAYRYQPGANFGHAGWASHYSPSSGVRWWDALNPDTTAYGRWIPWAVYKAFLVSLGALYVGYVQLQPLAHA